MPHTIYVGSRSLFVTATAWAFIVIASMASATIGSVIWRED